MSPFNRRRVFAGVTLVVYWYGFFAHIVTLSGLGALMLLYGFAWDIDLWRKRRKARTR